jgi:hypothetical protein
MSEQLEQGLPGLLMPLWLLRRRQEIYKERFQPQYQASAKDPYRLPLHFLSPYALHFQC